MKTLMAVLLAAAPALAAPQERVSESRPAAPDGLVEIENAAGSIRVIGWDRSEVAVSGTLGRGAEGLEIAGGKQRTRIEVEVFGNPHAVNSDLEIRVPADSRVSIESYRASISVSGVMGTVTAETVNSGIQVSGDPAEVKAESVNGGVNVAVGEGRVQADSVNGPVTVRASGGEINASTVNGPLTVTSARVERAHLETVNGRVLFEGGLATRGWLEVESVSGPVELALAQGTSADFTVTTFSGDIRNELGPPARRASRYTSEQGVSFSTGGGGAKVTVETLSGSVVLRRR